jgi:hypothetical protein
MVFHIVDSDARIFMYSMEDKGCVVGHVLVGDSSYDYDVLEAGTSTPPNVPLASEVVDSLNNIGIKASESIVGIPEEYLYTGIDGMYAVYNIGSKVVAVDLFSKEAYLTADLKVDMPSTREYHNRRNITSGSNPEYSINSSDYYYLDMYAYSGYCGPASGVSIGRYYRDVVGYSSLYSNGMMYSDLYAHMYCSYYGGATMPSDYGPGFEAMTEDCGYYNFSHENDWNITGSDYWTMVSHIDSGWPTALCITSDWHWRAIKGYYWIGAPDNLHYIWCTNSDTGDSWEFLNWDALGWGLFTSCIED